MRFNYNCSHANSEQATEVYLPLVAGRARYRTSSPVSSFANYLDILSSSWVMLILSSQNQPATGPLHFSTKSLRVPLLCNPIGLCASKSTGRLSLGKLYREQRWGHEMFYSNIYFIRFFTKVNFTYYTVIFERSVGLVEQSKVI